MDSTVVILTLVIYMGALVAVGLWASRRTHDQADFLLGGRGLGAFVAALSYSASASSAWTLLGLSGAAYVLGVRAVWIAVGATLTMLVAWFWIAPRLMVHTRERGQLTLTDFLAGGSTGPWRRWIVFAVSAIVIFSFVMYIAAQFQGAGNTFASTFRLPMAIAILIGAGIILVYTLLGGFWAVSVTDSIQGMLMAIAAVLVPVAALVALGGPAGFIDGLTAVGSAEQLSFSGGNAGLVAVGVIVGSIAIGIGTFGQPQLLVRFMALRDHRARRQAAWLTTAWYAVVFFGMVFLGLAGRVMEPALVNPETVFFALTEILFHPAFAAVLLAAVLSAIMSTADSQLVVTAAAISHDLGLARRFPRSSMLVTRLSVVLVGVVAVVVAVHAPARIFDRVLLSWIALGSAFGPLVFLRLAGMHFAAPAVLASILIGFAAAVGLPELISSPGMVVERTVPFASALVPLLLDRYFGGARSSAHQAV